MVLAVGSTGKSFVSNKLNIIEFPFAVSELTCVFFPQHALGFFIFQH